MTALSSALIALWWKTVNVARAANYLDDYFGRHEYGVWFEGDDRSQVSRPNDVGSAHDQAHWRAYGRREGIEVTPHFLLKVAVAAPSILIVVLLIWDHIRKEVWDRRGCRLFIQETGKTQLDWELMGNHARRRWIDNARDDAEIEREFKN